MSQIIDLNAINGRKDLNVYMLDSHGELTLIIESKNGIEYSEILGVMTIHDAKTKEIKQISNDAKEYISDMYNSD